MTSVDVSYQILEKTARELPDQILSRLSQTHRKFLLSVKTGNPEFGLIPVSNLENFPAIQWKVQNILKMEAKKRTAATEKLKSILGIP